MQDEQGEVIGFAKVTRDITERMQADESLRDSERRFRMLVDGVTDYAIYMLDPSGVVLDWNRGAERLKGYTQTKFLASISRNSIRGRTGQQAYRAGSWKPRLAKDASKAKAGGSARTAAVLGPGRG